MQQVKQFSAPVEQSKLRSACFIDCTGSKFILNSTFFLQLQYFQLTIFQIKYFFFNLIKMTTIKYNTWV